MITNVYFSSEDIENNFGKCKVFISQKPQQFCQSCLFFQNLIFLGLIPLVILIFLNLRILSRWNHFLHITCFSFLDFCLFLSPPPSSAPPHSFLQQLTFLCQAWEAFAAGWSWGRPPPTPPTATTPQVCQQSPSTLFCLSTRQTSREASNSTVSRLQPRHHSHLNRRHVLPLPLAQGGHQVHHCHLHLHRHHIHHHLQQLQHLWSSQYPLYTRLPRER